MSPGDEVRFVLGGALVYGRVLACADGRPTRVDVAGVALDVAVFAATSRGWDADNAGVLAYPRGGALMPAAPPAPVGAWVATSPQGAAWRCRCAPPLPSCWAAAYVDGCARCDTRRPAPRGGSKRTVTGDRAPARIGYLTTPVGCQAPIVATAAKEPRAKGAGKAARGGNAARGDGAGGARVAPSSPRTRARDSRDAVPNSDSARGRGGR